MALPRDPGSTANTAHNFGNLSGTENITEFLGATDSTDIYKFSLAETSDFSLGISGFSGSLQTRLYIDSNNNGQIDDGEYLYKDYRNAINSTLGAADYFVKVSRLYDTNTNYNLDLSATLNSPSIDTDPGSTANTAHNIGNLGGTENITEFIGSTDSTDIYKFSLAETSDFSLGISGFSGSLQTRLYIDSNNNGQIDDGEYLYKDYRNAINSTLGAADYFVKVSRLYDTNTNYNLDLSATLNSPSIDTDPGSTTDTAYEIQYVNLDTSEDNRNITEFIGSTDSTDIYKFSLTQTSDFSLGISGFSGSLQTRLYIDSNNNGQIDDGEYLYKDYRNAINSTLGAADYFVKVFRFYDTNTNYDLDFKFIADPVSIVSVTAQDAIAKEEGTNAAKFRITRDGDSSEARTIDYVIATGNKQATNGVDYEELTGSVTIPAEQAYVDVFVTPIDDDIVEFNKLEEVTVTLKEIDGDVGTGSTQTATVTIEDNDVIPTFTIEAADNEAKEEGEETGKFRIRHDVNTNKPQTVNYLIATGSGQATNGEDYRELSGSVTIPTGQDYIELTVKPKEDFLVEGIEKVTITVEDVDGNPGTQDNQTATLTIRDNDRHPTFTIEAADEKAGEERNNTGRFRIRHDGNDAIAHTVDYQISTGDNQAINGVDYAELSDSITIPAGQKYIDLTVTPTDDSNVENTETVTITVKDAHGNLGIDDNQTATVNIEDNDFLPPVFTIEAADNQAGEEGTNTGRFRLRHDGNDAVSQTVNLQIATGDNQAINGVDYSEISTFVTFPAGQQYFDLLIQPNNDRIVEERETVTITVEDVDGNLGTASNQTATLTIQDNDEHPNFTIETADNQAGEEGTNTGRFRLRHDGDDTIPQTVNLQIATGDNQAVNGTDYSEISTFVTFPAGQQYFDLLIQPNEDLTVEETERVTITVEDVDGNLGTASNQTATLTIQDNDEYPTFTIEATDNQAGEEGTNTGRFRLRHDGDTSQSQTINYQIATGSNQAINGVDYSGISSSITVPAGQGYIDLLIQPTDDGDLEDTEKVTITVKDINGDLGTASNQTATLTIQDNDEELLESPIYRFHNENVPGTYLFAGEAERDYIADNFANFDEEGMAFKVGVEPGDNLIPIYRFQSLATPGTYLFVGEEERQGINDNYSDSFDEEGLAFYVYGAGSGEGTTFYRFHNTGQPGTYIFAGPEERANILANFPSFEEEGAAFEVGA